jgi:phosphinothricin acetyltransferase
MTVDDWGIVRAIYLDGIATGEATFETAVSSWKQWDTAHLPAPRLIATAEKLVIGWAALSPVSARAVYAGVAEVSVYVATASRGQGVGRALLERLVEESENNGIWTLQASIFPENVASIRIHKACGFREVGTRERIGQRDGIWRDTRLLERRSRSVGSD